MKDSDEARRPATAEAFLEECNGGAPLPRALRRYAERLLGTDLEDTRVFRSSSVEMMDATAVAVGARIIIHPSTWKGFNDEHTVHLLVHELTHVAQQRAMRVPFQTGLVLDRALEGEAELAADRAVRELASWNPEGLLPPMHLRSRPGWLQTLALQPHPGTPIIRKALSWLGKRSTKALSKHIAKHTYRNFGKAIHGVFRSIDKIRPLVRQTLSEGVQLSEHFAKNSGIEMIERDGVRLARQTSQTPGKYRWLLQKEFKTAIGTKGEKVLRIVLDMSGRLVTAFPADKLLTILGTTVAVDIISESIADAAENVEVEAERLAKFEEMQRAKIDLWDLVPGIGNIWGGNLNEFEDLEMAHDRWTDQVVKDVIDQAEWRTGASLVSRPQLDDVIRVGMGLPVLLEHG